MASAKRRPRHYGRQFQSESEEFMQELIDAVGRFVFNYNYANWCGMNPSHKPLSAPTPERILILIRCSVPAAIGQSDVVLATALALSEHPLTPCDDGRWFVE